ncbi:hypothetical protein BC936DRAFT_142012 [Jimgerdemannia flammicorona]|uniref:Uncharacterized protein n=1 Tax=Jimgerdemannia flammicorona TaxID=994334 RepID=A0A433DFL5_9FUNG|nr:hypothetical protein BC936DRAFT_142012 [Jimgerdemannia flammicorona]
MEGNTISKYWTIDINGECPNNLVIRQLERIAKKIDPPGITSPTKHNVYFTKDKLHNRMLPLWWKFPSCPTIAVYFYYSHERFDHQSDEFLMKWLPRASGEFGIPLYVIVVRNYASFPSKRTMLERCRLSLPECKNVTYFLLNGFDDKLEDDEIQDIQQDFKQNIFSARPTNSLSIF